MRQKILAFLVFALVISLGGSAMGALGQGSGTSTLDIDLAPNTQTTIDSQQATTIKPDIPLFVSIDTQGVIYAFELTDQVGLRRYRVSPEGERWETAAVGDFTGDGRCEVFALTSTQRPNAYLFKNPLTQTNPPVFTPQLWTNNAYPAESFFFSQTIGDAATGDFDGDGRLDVAFTGIPCASGNCPGATGDGLVQILLNKASGVQRTSVNIPDYQNRSEERMAGIGSADFNQNGKMDLAAQHYWDNTGNLTYFLEGDGAGGFSLSTAFTGDHPGGVSALVAGDFDNDGIPDLIVGQDDDIEPGTTWFYKGQGNGSFTRIGEAYDTNPGETGSNKPGAGYADAYDVDGDGNLDVVAAARDIGIYLFKGNGDGTFEEGIFLHDEFVEWFKISTPNHLAEPCSWFINTDIYLPLVLR